MKRKLGFSLAIALVILCVAVFVTTCDGKGSDGVITIEMFNVAANYTGIQPGWFGVMLKDKFNIELNIIAPQVSGQTLFQTRSAAGNLGDIVVLDNAQFVDSVRAGLIKDISGEISKYPNLMYWKEQIDALNKDIPGAGGKIYGIPTEMTNTSPTSYSGPNVYSSPWLPWNLYVEAGAPRLNNLNDLLDVLEKIQRANPTGIDGNPAYAISLWPDWDDTSNENANQTLRWYGVEVASGMPTSSVLLGSDNRMKSLIDDNGEYRKMLKFFFDANQRGIVDPDSGTQQWDQMVVKMQNRRVYLWWYMWQVGFWNNTERGNNRENFIPIPVGDMRPFQEADPYYGSGRVFGVGSKVSGEKLNRVLALLDWLASPEGLMASHNGIPNFNYIFHPDGSLERTPEGERAFSDMTLRVPAEYGGGVWNDGMSWINQWMAHSFAVNPETGVPYDAGLWPREIEKAMTTTQREWNAMFNAENQVDYLRKNNMVNFVPRVNIILPSDPTDIQLTRSQCATITKDYSWRMIFARNEAEFNTLWNDMKNQLNGFGWDQLYQYDLQKFQAVVDARNSMMR